LARKHSHQLELADTLLERRRVPFDLGKAGIVLFGFDEFQELRALLQALRDLVELADRGADPGAFTAEFLRALRRAPDARVAELAVEFL